MFKKLKLGTKLIAVLLSVSLIPFIGITTFAYINAHDSLSNASYTKMDVFGKVKASFLKNWFSQKKSEAIVLANTHDIYDSMNTLKENGWNTNNPKWLENAKELDELTSSVLKQSNVNSVSLINPQGIVVYSTNKLIAGANLSSRDYFKKAVQGTANTSDIFYSDVINDFCMPLAAPIHSDGQDGEIVGVYMVLLDITQISSILLEDTDSLGESSKAYLIDKNGILLTKDSLGKLKTLESKIDTEAGQLLSAALNAGNTSFDEEKEYIDHRNTPVLGTLLYVQLGDVSAGLIVEQDSSVAFAAADILRNVMIIVCLISIIIIFAIGWFFSKSITRPIQSVANSLNEGAAQVAAASGQLSSSSQQLAEGNSEMAASIEETSATLEESSSMVQQNTENTKQAAQLSEQAKLIAEKGNEEMQEMISAMDEIKQSSDQIAKIIKVIDEIAFQTNILALNAAVEAARAGEAGMGFAVVAEEVRNLAQRCAQAAKDTAGMIEGNIKLSENGVVSVRKVAESLMGISAQTKKVNELMDEISAASQEQSQGIIQINKAISQMEQVTQQNAASSEESAASAEQLSAQAEALKDIVKQLYRLVNGISENASENAGHISVRKLASHSTASSRSIHAGSIERSLPVKHYESTHIVNPEEIIPLESDPKDF